MRKLWLLITGLAAVMVVLPAAGQAPGNFGTPVNLNMKPPDLTTSGKTPTLSKIVRTPTAPSIFGLNKVFPKISLGSWPPGRPSMPVLQPNKNQFQPNPIAGTNPFGLPKK